MNKPTPHQAESAARPPAGALATQWAVAGRVLAALLGGYAFCWGFIALGIAALFAVGMEFHDAEHLASMLAFLLYVGVFLWAIAARSLARVWLVLLGGGATMAALASVWQLFLVP